MEDLELAELQGAEGLRALRVTVDLTHPEHETPLAAEWRRERPGLEPLTPPRYASSVIAWAVAAAGVAARSPAAATTRRAGGSRRRRTR